MKIITGIAMVIILITSSLVVNAQEYSKKSNIPWTDRIFVGGNLGLTFGDITSVEVAPQVGYMITPRWAAGLGFRYSYYRNNYYNYESSSYGPQFFSRFMIFKGLYAEGIYEANNMEIYKLVDPVRQTYVIEREWISSLLLGGGYSSQIGGRSSFFISIL